MTDQHTSSQELQFKLSQVQETTTIELENDSVAVIFRKNEIELLLPGEEKFNDMSPENIYVHMNASLVSAFLGRLKDAVWVQELLEWQSNSIKEMDAEGGNPKETTL